MKKVFIPLMLVCIAFIGCDEELNVTLNAPYDVDATLEAVIVTGTGEPIELTLPAVNTGDEALGDYSDKLDKLESATLTSLSVTITNPQGEDFSFMNTIEFFINGQGMTEQRVAGQTNIDQTSSTIVLDVEDVELVEVIKSGEFTGRAVFVNDELIEQDLDLNIEFQFDVEAAVID